MNPTKLQDVADFLAEQNKKLRALLSAPVEKMPAAQFVTLAKSISPDSLEKMIRPESMPDYREIFENAVDRADALPASAQNIGVHANLWSIVEWAKARMLEEESE